MTLRARVVVGMALIALVLVGSSYAIARTTQAQLMEGVDSQLEDLLASAVRTADDAFGVVEQCTRTQETSVSDGPSVAFVGVVIREGETCPSLGPNTEGSAPEPVVLHGPAERSALTSEPFTAQSKEPDTRYRVRAAYSPTTGNLVFVALPLDDVDASVDKLIGVEVVATLAVLSVLGLVAFWVIHLGVRPVKQMTATATAIAAGDLSPRVPEADPGTEAGQLGRALNRMLGRIERAFDQRTRSEEQLRQFLADASHELRTPITTVRGYAELYQAGGLAAHDDLDEAMRRTGQEAVRMGALVEDMLLLARLDQGRPMDSSPVDVAALVADAGRDTTVVDPDRTITVDAEGPLMVRGDSDRLRQVIANLVGNALVHTPPGTPVEITASAGPAAPTPTTAHSTPLAEPNTPGGPGGSNEPGGPGGSDRTGTSGETAAPGGSDASGTAGRPGRTGTSDRPGGSDRTGTSGETAAPGGSDASGTAGGPGRTGTSDRPGGSGGPGGPGAPASGADLGEPDASATPGSVAPAVGGDRAVITVVDHGPGMPEEAVAHAFERFFRADRSRSRSQGGSGLGLSIVHAIVTSHGGTVTLTSTEGEGTTARVELPLLGSDAPPPPPTAAAEP